MAGWGVFWVNAANLKTNSVLFILIQKMFFFCISPNSIISNTIWCVCVLYKNRVTLYFAEQEIQCKQQCFPRRDAHWAFLKEKTWNSRLLKQLTTFFHGTQEPHQRVAGRTLGNTALENAQEILNPKILIKYIGVLSIEAHR